MKNSFYFQHDSNARNDEKILELRCKFGNEGYAIYFMLLESMSETNNGYLNREAMGGLSLGYNVAKSLLKQIIDKCIKLNLFILDKNLFSSPRMLKHLAFRQNLSDAGKRGAKVRWSSRSKNRGVNSPAIRGVNAKGKERKGKESKTKKINKRKYLSIKDLTDIHFQKIADKYNVPISFVRSKYDDMVNWHESTGKMKKDWIATLRNFVKKDAIKLKKEHNAESKISVARL